MANSKTVQVFLLGLLTGAASAILLAPHKGSKTRKKMYRAAKILLGSAKDKAGELGQNIKDVLG
jgi:gas vesicle protein